ncbi:MAG TPA: hypothetical protein VNK49_07875 [Anaerolineales bacterium]|nr:hypothetical protein [Anaerolineales bacterium]
MKKVALTVLMLTFFAQACNIPSTIPITPSPTAPVLPSPTQPLPTNTATQTPSPTDTPLPTLTFTPAVPVAFPKDVAVNCRFGPGTAWVVLSGLNVGQSAQILGRSTDGNWWYIVDPFGAGRNCWVAASVVNTAGNVTLVPVFEAPQASVTNVSVRVKPAVISIAGCVGPVPVLEIEGTIETNGPTTVKWYFETQQGGAMSTRTSDFDTFGAKIFSADYTPILAAGTYWIRLIVTAPNPIQAETTYRIECP